MYICICNIYIYIYIYIISINVNMNKIDCLCRLIDRFIYHDKTRKVSSMKRIGVHSNVECDVKHTHGDCVYPSDHDGLCIVVDAVEYESRGVEDEKREEM
jgi:hypothetical protein